MNTKTNPGLAKSSPALTPDAGAAETAATAAVALSAAPAPAAIALKVASVRATKTSNAAKTSAKPKAVSAAPAPKTKSPVKTPTKAEAATASKAVPTKPAKPVKVIKAVKPIKAEKPEKPKKPKLVRDSFTIPKAEYDMLDALKARAIRLTQPAKKSELLRAGVKLLVGLTDAAFLAALRAVPALKTGRPAAAPQPKKSAPAQKA